jgi:dihydroflavonol-4-reductase
VRVLVTGATGFLGMHLCHRLVADGHDVTALHRPTSDVADLPALGVRLVVGDIADDDAVRQAVSGQDVVVHAAAHIAYWRGYRAEHRRVNVDGTRIVAEAYRKRGAGRLVLVSSVAAIGIPGPGDGPADENFPFNLASSGLNYHISKRQAEEAVRQEMGRGLDAVIVNPGTIFGPARRGYRGGEMIEKVRGRGVVPYFIGGINAVHVDDVVDGILRATSGGESGERYILGGENVSYRRIVELATAEFGQRSVAIPVPPFVTGAASALMEPVGSLTGRRPPLTRDTHLCSRREQYYCSEKARAAFGYVARPFTRVVREYIDWNSRAVRREMSATRAG